MDNERFMTVAAAARLMRVSRVRAYQMVNEGKLSDVRIGGVRFVRRAEAEEWSAWRAERWRLLRRDTEHVGSECTSKEGENVTDE